MKEGAFWLSLIAASFGATSGLIADATRRFDVASVKPTGNLNAAGRVQFLPGGTFRVTNCDLPFIIQQVYGLPEWRVIRGPEVSAAWGNPAFDIVAKTDTPVTETDAKLMAQQLLSERFKLRVHWDKREMPVYVLSIDKAGKIQFASGGRGRIEFVEKGVMRGKSIDIDSLVRALSRYSDRPVINSTRIDKTFDFSLTWADASDTQPADTSRPSLFTAVREQLGLKLEAQKEPIDVLVVDNADTSPSVN